MTHRITAALHLIRDDLAAVLSPQTIRKVCADVGYRWRNRILDPITTIHLFVLQILNRNTASTHLRHLSGRLFSASAYCQARSRLPLVLLERLLERIVDAIDPLTDPLTDPGRWRGHRTWLVDGTGVSMPDTANLQRAFGQPTNQAPGCGFPVARIFALFHAGTGFLMRMIVAPLRTHEAAFVTQLHATMKSGDVLVGDRAFGTFGHLTTLISRGLHGVFRVAGTRVVDFTPGRDHAPRWNGPKATGRSRAQWIRTLGPQDQVVQWVKGYACPVWMTAEAFAALPVTVTVREVRYAITQRGFRVRVVTLVTTLLDPIAYPAEALADLSRSRWRVETNLAHLKTTLGMDVLHCQTEAGVRREIVMFAIVSNLVRTVMGEAGRRQEVPAERISFIDALRWLTTPPTGDPLPPLVVNPNRPDRIEPRSQKRRAKKYPYMKTPRTELRKRLLEQVIAA